VEQQPVTPFYDVSFSYNQTTDGTELSRDETLRLLFKSSPILTYIDRTYAWQPRYTLDMHNFDDGEFRGWANLINNGERSVQIQRAELNGGDIKLRKRGKSYEQMQQQKAFGSAMETAKLFQVQEMGEQSGTYVYQINQMIQLCPKSTTSIPFLKPLVEIKRFVRYSSSFSTSNIKESCSNVTS